ncbi:DUF2334 domain-containing protein [Paenibacillus sp. LjRoot56]|uniref:DUF2334 domain-containing protein n=1 Tax=Paenibacillus sp. LjRoot56 TaxID=3342333 RepID=UPI003ED0094C
MKCNMGTDNFAFDGQWIILKADDLVYSEDSPDGLSPAWNRFFNEMERRGIVASLGLIGNTLENADERFVYRVKHLIEKGHEIWNHGYDHMLSKENDQNVVCYEFQNTSAEYQLEHLLRTQQLARKRLGVVLRTFGAPGNAIDDHTTKALEAVPDLMVWLFGRLSSKAVLERVVDIEHPVIHPNLEAFRQQYEAKGVDKKYLLLQIHPPHWNAADFTEFVQVMDYLEQKPVRFITPYRFYTQYY